MENTMNANEILKKIYEDRQQMSDDMMYFYTDKECQEAFGMSLDDIGTMIPKEFVNVITCENNGEDELTTWGDFERVYEEYVSSL